MDKWVFPDVTLEPQAYLVVFASGKNRLDPAGELHTHFQLDRAGEFLALLSPDNTVVSVYGDGYPEQKRDHSYGLDASGEATYFLTPTPGEANSAQTAEGLVKAPQFTPDHGLFHDPVSVSITTATPDATILYRMDPQNRALTEAIGSTYTGTPLTLTGDAGRAVFNIRAMAVKPNHIASDVVSASYIFPDLVLQQSVQPDGGFPLNWGSGGGTVDADYQMDPDILDQQEYHDMAGRALAEAPSMMVTMDVDDLFAADGIYVNADEDCPAGSGVDCAWERPCSAEMIYPGNHKGFKINCGIRMQGGTSQHAVRNMPKLSFRLIFRDDYGPSTLRFPLFPDSNVNEFDTLVLDAKMNQTWVHPDESQAEHCQFVREIVCDDWQNMMGSCAAHNTCVNLYVNGLHWGLYSIRERCDHDFAASYLGGDGDDYDCIKHGLDNVINPDPPDTARATDAWHQMVGIVSGGTVSDQDILDIQSRLSLPDFCDYMIMNLFAGNSNWANQNWFATHHIHDGQWMYHSWDADYVLKAAEVNRSVIDYSTGEGSPTMLFDLLRTNAEFRRYFADRVHRAFFNGGIFFVNPWLPQWNPAAPNNNMPAKQYMKRIDEINELIVLESARWGDYRRPSYPYTREDWLNELDVLLANYFPKRTQFVLDQFRASGLYPDVAAPGFGQHGGDIQAGQSLVMGIPGGGNDTIYYTLDGTDPRVFGTGDAAASARVYSAPVTLSDSCVVKARVRSNNAWSALNEAAFHVTSPYRGLKVTEIMYHPPEGNLDSAGFYEFIELKNAGTEIIDLSRLQFTEGIQYEFPQGVSLAPGRFLVLAADGPAFEDRYPGTDYAGVYAGGLDDDGDRVTLADPEGAAIFSFAYHDAAWWPTEPDGSGYSLVPNPGQPEADPNRAEAWMPSRAILGSPGGDDTAADPAQPVIIKHPVDVALAIGQSAVFSVVAACDGTPTYQWQKNGADIDGADQAEYTTPPVKASDSNALFACVVSHAGRQAASHPAKVMVLSTGSRFLRGDANADNGRNLADAVTMLQYLFTNGSLPCHKSADANDDGKLDLGDPVSLLVHLFTDPEPLPEPFSECGADGTGDDLTCDRFMPCE